MTQMTLTVAKRVKALFSRNQKVKSFKELIKSLTPACDSGESDDDFDKAFQPLFADNNIFFVALGEPTESEKQVMQAKSNISD